MIELNRYSRQCYMNLSTQVSLNSAETTDK